jgi:hypothetical protein
MFVCCECCVLSRRGLCDELITCPEENYRLWCVVVCELENLKNEEAMTRIGSQRHTNKWLLLRPDFTKLAARAEEPLARQNQISRITPRLVDCALLLHT